MENSRRILLGISLGTRYIGTALFEEGVLVDWHTKVFKMPWSDTKMRIIRNVLLRIIEQEEVSTVIVRVPPEQKQGYFLQKLGRYLFQTFKEHSINFCLRDIRTNTSPPKQKELHRLILTCYPELMQECKREQQNKTTYYYKIFEAVESVHCILKKQ
ncbi:MAG: hypothetical protein HEQ40_12380 [Lacibacter sp.]